MEKQYGGGEKPPLSNFNEAQKKAVCHRDGPCMVLAGPGSGKTSGMDDSEFADPA